MSKEPTRTSTEDRTGAIVTIGTVVRVIHISSSILEALDAREQARVQSMLGNELAVYDVDQWGCAWVEKWWREDKAHSTSHSLALKPMEMEVVHRARA
jgi:hypothetical protein